MGEPRFRSEWPLAEAGQHVDDDLLSDAAEAGALTFTSPAQVMFDPGLSEDAERYFAGTFQVGRLVARAVLRSGA